MGYEIVAKKLYILKLLQSKKIKERENKREQHWWLKSTQVSERENVLAVVAAVKNRKIFQK